MIKGDVAKKLGIDNISVKRSGQESIIPVSLCALFFDCWYVISQEILAGSMLLSFRWRDNAVAIPVRCEPVEYEDMQCCRVSFCGRLPEGLERGIMQYLSLENRLDRRKEERYDVGIKNKAWQRFGFKVPLQKLYLNKHFLAECAVVNVSVHGALVIALKGSPVPRESVVTLCMNFVNPQETVIENALVVGMDCPGEKLFRYSLNLISPGIAWKERIASYADSFSL